MSTTCIQTRNIFAKSGPRNKRGGDWYLGDRIVESTYAYFLPTFHALHGTQESLASTANELPEVEGAAEMWPGERDYQAQKAVQRQQWLNSAGL